MPPERDMLTAPVGLPGGNGCQLLISFCNLPYPREAGLLWLDTASGRTEPLQLQLPDLMASCAGLARAGAMIYALVQVPNHVYVVGFKVGSFAPTFWQLVPEVYDGHSIAVLGEHLYIVSTGTDRVIRYELTSGGLKNATVVWQASSTGVDTHHISSLMVWGDRLIVTAFGPKTGETWETALDGYMHDITRDS